MMDRAETYGWTADMGVPLMEKIKSDTKVAMKSKDTGARDALRMVVGELPSLTVPITLESGKKSFRVKTAEEITDEELLGIIGKFVKAEKSVLEVKGEEHSDFLEVLETYLPKLASEGEIRVWIEDNVDFSLFKNHMQAMGSIMKHFGKNADGNLVKTVLQSFG